MERRLWVKVCDPKGARSGGSLLVGHRALQGIPRAVTMRGAGGGALGEPLSGLRCLQAHTRAPGRLTGVSWVLAPVPQLKGAPPAGGGLPGPARHGCEPLLGCERGAPTTFLSSWRPLTG